MAKYPIDNESDQIGIVDALNYVLSGPAGLGQNFSGYSSNSPAYIRPTSKQPFMLPITTTTDPSWYLNIPITTIATVGANPTATLDITFATPYAEPPFELGDLFVLYNTVAAGLDPDFYNYRYYKVLSCTTTTVRVAYTKSDQLVNQTWPGLSAPGGNLVRNFYDILVSTDCNGRVSVQGGTDRVFINGQLLLDFDYTASMASEFELDVMINRYKGYPNTDPGTVDFYFIKDALVASRTYHYSVTAPGVVQDLETIFTSVIEQNLPLGYYWYILEVSFRKTNLAVGGLISNEGFENVGYKPSGQPADLPMMTTFTGLTPVNVSSSGSGAVMDIDVYAVPEYPYNFAINLTIRVTTPGNGYRPGDIIKIPGNLLGGATPDNDLTLEVLEVDDPGDAYPGKFVAKLRSLTAQVVKE